MDDQRNSPLHLILQRREEKEMESILSIANLLCDYGQAHPDCVNRQLETPIETTVIPAVKRHMEQKLSVSRLKCLCARRIQAEKFTVRDSQFPRSLKEFIRIH